MWHRVLEANGDGGCPQCGVPQKPVMVAIFFYGKVDEDCQEDPNQDDPLMPVPGLKSAPPNVSREVCNSVGRLRVNAEHPSKAELKRLLASHGSITTQILAAIKHLKCGSCERTKKPLQPRPAAVPAFAGQFGERLQADVVYIRDLSGTNHAVLGILCTATSLQQAGRLMSRNPCHAANTMRQLWLSPYGYPLQLMVDSDGRFAAEFLVCMEEAGVHTVVVFVRRRTGALAPWSGATPWSGQLQSASQTSMACPT